jgi:hypothetical protein
MISSRHYPVLLVAAVVVVTVSGCRLFDGLSPGQVVPYRDGEWESRVVWVQVYDRENRAVEVAGVVIPVELDTGECSQAMKLGTKVVLLATDETVGRCLSLPASWGDAPCTVYGRLSMAIPDGPGETGPVLTERWPPSKSAPGAAVFIIGVKRIRNERTGDELSRRDLLMGSHVLANEGRSPRPPSDR